MDKNKVVVTVHGREYTLVGAEPVDYMQRVAGYVDRRMSEISYAVTAMRREMTQMRQALAKAEWAAHTAGKDAKPEEQK